jgi:5-methylthioadenosine/S-adenosylhomocysteine deaminase
MGVEHLFHADEAAQRRAVAMAQRYNTAFHSHCSEAEIEIAEFNERHGCHPMMAPDRLGFFDVPHTTIAHAAWLDQEKVELVASRGVSVAHNPVSNMELASGIAPVKAMLAAGVAVG